MIDFKDKYIFLYNKINHHFAIIIGENNNKYFYLSLTHSKYFNKIENLELFKNPNNNDLSNAYIVNKIRKADKKFFKDTAKHLKLSILDKELLDLKIIQPFIKKQENIKEVKEKEIKNNEEKKRKIIELINVLQKLVKDKLFNSVKINEPKKEKVKEKTLEKEK